MYLKLYLFLIEIIYFFFFFNFPPKHTFLKYLFHSKLENIKKIVNDQKGGKNQKMDKIL